MAILIFKSLSVFLQGQQLKVPPIDMLVIFMCTFTVAKEKPGTVKTLSINSFLRPSKNVSFFMLVLGWLVVSDLKELRCLCSVGDSHIDTS